jgi:hypothetical protein
MKMSRLELFDVLERISSTGEVSVSNYGRAAGVSQQHASRILARMADSGLIRRRSTDHLSGYCWDKRSLHPQGVDALWEALKLRVSELTYVPLRRFGTRFRCHRSARELLEIFPPTPLTVLDFWGVITVTPSFLEALFYPPSRSGHWTVVPINIAERIEMCMAPYLPRSAP